MGLHVCLLPHSKTMHPPIRPRLTWSSRSSRSILHQRNLSNLPQTINQIFSRQIPSAEAQESEPITVHGWIKSVRKQKRFAFAEIRDGTTSKPLQAVLSAELARPLVFQFLPWFSHLMLSFLLKIKQWHERSSARKHRAYPIKTSTHGTQRARGKSSGGV